MDMTLKEELEMSITQAKHEIRMIKDMIPAISMIDGQSAKIILESLPAIESGIREIERELVKLNALMRAQAEILKIGASKIH